MTDAELRQALISRRPVVYTDPLAGDIRCRSVCAVRITCTEEGILTSAEVLDRHTGAVMVVRPERLRYAEEDYD